MQLSKYSKISEEQSVRQNSTHEISPSKKNDLLTSQFDFYLNFNDKPKNADQLTSY